MIYTPLTNKAMRIAYNAHHGQVDQGGQPYIFHPIHLAEQMDNEISICVALLHDVVEDSNVTIADLQEEFPSVITDAVQLLTHKVGTDYFHYVRAIRDNPIAKEVKLADLAHNSDETRLKGCAGITPEKLARWQKKYTKAMAILLGLKP